MATNSLYRREYSDDELIPLDEEGLVQQGGEYEGASEYLCIKYGRKFCYSLGSRRDNLLPNALKAVAVTASYITQYPYMNAARLATTNPVLKEMFAVGTLVAWGTLYAVTAMYVIDCIFLDKKNVSSNACSTLKTVAYWFTVGVFAIAAQIPDMYVSYTYTNDSLFWPIFVAAVYSFFSLNSIDSATQQIARTNNFITRYAYRNTNTCEIFQAQENFCQLLNESLISSIEERNSRLTSLFYNTLIKDTEDNPEPKVLILMMNYGLERKIIEIGRQNTIIEAVGKVIKISTWIIFLARYYLEIQLTNKASKLILDNKVFAVFLIVLTLTPNIYLNTVKSGSTVTNACLAIMRFIDDIGEGRWREYLTTKNIYKSIGYTCAATLAVLGIGQTVTVVKANVIFEHSEILQALILFFTGSLATNTMIALYNKIHNYILLKCGNEAERALLETIEAVRGITGFVERMSTESFVALISSLEILIADIVEKQQELADPEIKPLISQLADADMLLPLRQRLSQFQPTSL